jgi:Protein of unknown function (DUF4242)
MKNSLIYLAFVLAVTTNCSSPSAINSDEKPLPPGQSMFIDVHNLEPGKVTMADVAAAHEKDLATQGRFDVSFVKYWVDEGAGKVYCLAHAKDSASVSEAHKAAHGLIPQEVRKVQQGE